jgi:hypothetical protein
MWKNMKNALSSSTTTLLHRWSQYDQRLTMQLQRLWYMSTYRVKSFMQGKGDPWSNNQEIANQTSEPQEDVPFMITKHMKAQLIELGYKSKQVSDMTPAEASKIIKANTYYSPPPTTNSPQQAAPTAPVTAPAQAPLAPKAPAAVAQAPDEDRLEHVQSLSPQSFPTFVPQHIQAREGNVAATAQHPTMPPFQFPSIIPPINNTSSKQHNNKPVPKTV